MVYENGKDTVESQPMVYVTESGSVYHRKLGCSYLNLSVQQISGSSVKACLLYTSGENGDEDFRLLEMCRKIYMPVLNDTLSVCKVTQFENLLRIWNKEKILEKTEKVHLPFHMDRISSDEMCIRDRPKSWR